MIKDSVANIRYYDGISENISRALRYLQNVDAAGFGVETVALEGTNVVALHQQYTTEPVEGRLFENHTSHLDVQFVVAGTETIRVTDVRALSAASDYDPNDDVTLYDLADGSDIHLTAGDFVVLFPHDAHIPKLHSGAPAAVKKIVVKIAIHSMEAS